MKLIYFVFSLFSILSVYCDNVNSGNNNDLGSFDISPLPIMNLSRGNCPSDPPPCDCGSSFTCTYVLGDDDKCNRYICTEKPPDVLAIILGSIFGILGFCLLGVGVLLWTKRHEIKEAGGLFKYFQEKRPSLPTHFSYKSVNGSFGGFSSFSSRTDQSTISRMPSILLEAKPEKINFQNGLQAAKLVDLDSESRAQSIIAQVTPNTIASESILTSPIVRDFSEVKPDSEIQPSQTEFFSFQEYESDAIPSPPSAAQNR